MSRAAAEPATWHQRTFHGRANQVSRVRQEIAQYLGDSPLTDDAVLITSELASNAILYSHSKGRFFTVRAEISPGYVRIECEDLGGAWHCKPGDGRPHGLDIIQALTGPGNWGVETTSDGDRVVWARLNVPREGRRT